MGINRRRRRRNNFRQKTQVNFNTIIVIIGIAVLLGYGVAKFVIYPIFNDDGQKTGESGFKLEKFLSFFIEDENKLPEGTDESKEEEQGTQEQKDNQSTPNPNLNVVEDQLNIQKPEEVSVPVAQSGYCIQFGSFTTKLSAETLVSELSNSGIQAEILEKDGAFKVISQLFQQKDQAVATLNTLVGTPFTDAFITQR